jgi:hypothetical protein
MSGNRRQDGEQYRNNGGWLHGELVVGCLSLIVGVKGLGLLLKQMDCFQKDRQWAPRGHVECGANQSP